MLLDPEQGGSELVGALNACAEGMAPEEIIALALDTFSGATKYDPEPCAKKKLEQANDSGRNHPAVAAVSSFGADSAVLLHMIATYDRSVPVLFLDTGKHFGETLTYRDAVVRDLGLSDLRIIAPRPDLLDAGDPDGKLHLTDVDTCCDLRKVEPMARAVAPFKAWFNGRKRFQTGMRAELPVFENVGPRIRINPLARLSAGDVRRYAEVNGLRANPLVAFGYLSIGCFPCTRPVAAGGSARDGRWAGMAKVECGIHLTQLEDSLATAGSDQ